MRTIMLSLSILLISFLVGCTGNDQDDFDDLDDELAFLEVEFELPEKAEVGETVELKAIVTYGGEIVDDAEEMYFEYWLEGHEDDSVFVDSINQGDGTYTAEVVFDREGVYQIYAHTTARAMHNMPLKSIVIGEGSNN